MFEAIIAALGGGVVVGTILLKGLGNVISSRVTENIRAGYAKEMEGVKHQLQLLREGTVRFDAEQFRSYRELWAALYDLRRAADKLWERATISHFQAFGQNLLTAEITIGRKRLLLESHHAEALDRLIDVMWALRIGKKRLIDLRRRGEGVADFEIDEAIQKNKEWIETYAALMDDIESDFRRQIRGERGPDRVARFGTPPPRT